MKTPKSKALNKIKPIKPYVIYKGKKYVRGFGLQEYKGSAKKWADKFYQ